MALEKPYVYTFAVSGQEPEFKWVCPFVPSPSTTSPSAKAINLCTGHLSLVD